MTRDHIACVTVSPPPYKCYDALLLLFVSLLMSVVMPAVVGGVRL